MEWSAHNIFANLHESSDCFLVNPLSRQADILDSETSEKVRSFLKDQTPLPPGLLEEMVQKGYLIEPDKEQRHFRTAYLDFLDNREEDEIQIFFVPSYQCNFNCSYCYQEEYLKEPPAVDQEVMDAFFSYISREFAGKKKYITLFGGEPLLPGASSRTTVERLIEGANRYRIELAVVTNGYALADYISLLQKASIREIQITLDGTPEIHNHRRPLHSGEGTFAQVARGIDLALDSGLPVNLRTVVDRENLSDLPALAQFAADRGWSSNELFKTQIGRNYELHSCQADSGKLLSRIELYQELYRIINENSEFTRYYRPAFSISKFLFERGEMPEPLFDACPACKTEWAFDYTGRIFPCTATVGKSGEAIGRFYRDGSAVVELDLKAAAGWEGRDVTSVKECHECSLALACGGGCGSVAKNRNGSVSSPDCRPVKELLALGLKAGLNGKLSPVE